MWDVHGDVWARRDVLLTGEARAGRHGPHFAHLGREGLREAVTKARAACQRRGREAGGVWDVHGDVWPRRDMLLRRARVPRGPHERISGAGGREEARAWPRARWCACGSSAYARCRGRKTRRA